MHTRYSFHSCTSLRLGGLALTSLALTALAPIAVQAQAYNLSFLSGTINDGAGVNASGQVTEGAFTAGSVHAFLSGPNGADPLKDLGTLPGTADSYGNGINDFGQVAGYSGTAGNVHAFLSGPNGGPLQDLGTLSGDTKSFGTGVNASGQVTGYSQKASGAFQSGGSHAFLSGVNGGPLKDLGTLPGDTFSEGLGVNNSGQVTGQSSTSSTDSHAFLSGVNGGPLKDLGTLPNDTYSIGTGVNASGQVTGQSGNIPNFGFGHAFLSSPNGGPLQDLGSLPYSDVSAGAGVNDSGQVVGDTFLSNNLTVTPYHAFLFSKGVMYDLNNLIAPGSGFTLQTATGISNTGFIIGTARDNLTLLQRSFLLTPTGFPIPEASSVVSLGLLLALGLGGVVVARRKRTA